MIENPSRILIIDDDPNLRKTLTDILRFKGYEVIAVDHGAQGLDLAQKNPFDLLLLDLGLPDIPGLEVMAGIKEAQPAIEVIILTGNATLDSAIAVTNRGAFCYLIKPYEIEQLLLHVRRAIEKRRTEEELRRVNETLRMIFNSVNDAIFIHETNGQILDVNDRMLEMYRVGREEATTFSIMADYSAPCSKPEILPELWREVAEGNSRFFEWKARRPGDGSLFDVEVFLRRITLRGKDAILATVRNISERKRAEQELEGSRAELAANHEKLKTLFLQVEAVKKEWENCMDSIGDMVILADREGRIRRCNKTVRECTGKTYEQISGADWRTFLMDHGLKLQAPYASGTEIRHEETGKWFVFNSYPFLEHAGREMSGVVVTLHDTTELKRVTQALDDAYRELQATHAQMLHKEKMASIGLLAAGVAHEINNPLGFILSNLGTLDKYVQRLIGFVQAQAEMLASPERGGGGALLAEKRKQLKLDYIMDDITQVIAESREGAERVKKIVQNLRSFSRLDEAEWKPADLHECLENTLNMVWNEIKYKAEITRDYGELPMIDCNPGQINQVFMNLLVNAAHAIEAQGTITLRTRCEEGFVRVSIADTGCGIPEGIRARIFEPFFTTKDVGKGTGLGLGISYDIVKKHGGEILVESETGKGSTFTVVLPVGK